MSGIYRGPNGSATADALNIDGDKGDLTISNSGLEWNINPDVVDFSKIQNISTDVLLGRATSGSGNIEEITCTAAGRALLDDANSSAQRTTLGLGNAATATIGTDVLAYDANLQSFVNTFTLPTTDATNGFVLSTNGAGTLSLTAPGGIPDGDKGDISVSTGGTVWTIDNDVVTYAKIQNVSATDKLLGRSTAGAGVIEEITCTSAGRALLDDADATTQRTTLGLGSLATLNSITNAELDNQYLNDLPIVTFDADSDYVAIADGSDSGNKKKALIPQTVLQNYLTGLTFSTAGSSSSFSVAPGQATDSANSVLMTLVTAISKTTAAWAVGTGNGGLDTGTIANSSTYHAYLIRRPDTGVVDVIFSLSASAPTLPANYTQYRRIFSMRTEGAGKWNRMFQNGNIFMLETAIIDVDAVNPGTSAVTRTLSVPTGIVVDAVVSIGGFYSNQVHTIVISSLDVTDQAGQAYSTGALTGFPTQTGGNLGGAGWNWSTFTVKTNTSAQIRSRLSASGSADRLGIITRGWIDTRGR